MNCQAVQNQILALPDPRELPAALRGHVAACADCRAWARQAARLNSLVAQLSVPPAPNGKKEALLGDLMQAEPVIRPMPAPAARPGYGDLAARFLRRNAAYVGGLAAAVLVALGLYSVFGGSGQSQRADDVAKREDHPLLRKIVAGNRALARAETPARKLDELGSLAGTVSDETRGMARIASGAELKEMAGWYESYVKTGMVAQAREIRERPLGMTEAEKARLLESHAAKLAADAAASEKLVGEAPPDAHAALKKMAEAAREGEKSLRAAARGGI